MIDNKRIGMNKKLAQSINIKLSSNEKDSRNESSLEAQLLQNANAESSAGSLDSWVIDKKAISKRNVELRFPFYQEDEFLQKDKNVFTKIIPKPHVDYYTAKLSGIIHGKFTLKDSESYDDLNVLDVTNVHLKQYTQPWLLIDLSDAKLNMAHNLERLKKLNAIPDNNSKKTKGVDKADE